MPRDFYHRLLEEVAAAGEVDGPDLVARVPRKSTTLADFYGLAALIESGFIAANTAQGGPFGTSTWQRAALLCQLNLKPGETLRYGEATWDAWDGGPIKFFITGAGVLKLEELHARKAAAKQKRWDYAVSAGVAIMAAVATTTLAHFYTEYRAAHAPPAMAAAEMPRPPTPVEPRKRR